MATVVLPYGKEHLKGEIPDNRYLGELNSSLNSYKPAYSEQELVDMALQSPVDSPALSELARDKKQVVLIASDHTRPVPSKLIVPSMLREIRKFNPSVDITILIATGCHRETSKEELRNKFGDDIFNKEKIVVHDCDDEAHLVTLGTLPSGGELKVNSLITEADLVVSEGFIEPHFFAGFSGGRKSILPGVCARKTVIYNHNAKFIDDPHSRTGILEGNLIHQDMEAAAKMGKLAFIVNVVINSEKKVVFATAGNAISAHKKGCEFLLSLCQVEKKESDIVITTNGGYPLDQNIYQSVKGMTAAEALVKKDGVIIMLSKCNDGHGGKVFYETFRDEKDLSHMMDGFLKTPADETKVDQWQSQIFARVMMHATVIFISDAEDQMVRDLHMIPAHSVEEAIRLADEILQSRGIEKATAKILSVPDGVSVIVS